jgi:integrase
VPVVPVALPSPAIDQTSALDQALAACNQDADQGPFTLPGLKGEVMLTQEELRKLWHSLGTDDFSDIVRLLLLTGQRRNEIGRLAWGEIDFGTKIILLPPERVKNGREHSVPLSPQNCPLQLLLVVRR